MTGRKGTSRRKKDALTPFYCEIPGCHYSKVFQRHRILPGRDGGKYRLGNVIALCPNHHAEADRGWIPPEYLLDIVRTRIERGIGVKETIDSETPAGASEPETVRSRPAEEPAESDGDSALYAEDGSESRYPAKRRSRS